MSSRFIRLVLVAAALGLGGCGDDDPPPAITRPPSLPLWGQFEVTVPKEVNAANPFDETEIAVRGEFRSPQGEVQIVDGFVSRDYSRELIGGRERLTPSGELQWRIRFTPAAQGTWQWRWTVSSADGDDSGPWSTLQVGAPVPGQHGFVRRSPGDSRYLEFDDGTSFFAVGENLSWYDGRGTFAYDEWVARLAAQGCNYMRLWMPSWAFGLEWITRAGDGTVESSTLGNYTLRLDRAWQLDRVFELAHRHGIHVMLSLQNHGPFSLTSNSEWADNPYSAANGGPLRQPRDFFTDEQARDLFRRRLRYVVARWGHATNLMSWELWNEVDLVQQPPIADVLAWHREMAGEIARLDPYGRLLSTSLSQTAAVGGGSPFAALWDLEEIDFTQVHAYAFEGNDVDFTRTLPRLVGRLRRHGKPVLVAEAGVDFRGPAETIRADPDADGFHDILWSGVFAESFGSGMSWWWDNVVDPEDLYFHFGPLAAFVGGVDFPAEGFAAGNGTAVSPGGQPLRPLVLRGRERVLVWLKNDGHAWYAPDHEPVLGATLRLEEIEDGSWEAVWFDTRTGMESEPLALRPQGGIVQLDVPPFSRDVALRLQRPASSTGG